MSTYLEEHPPARRQYRNPRRARPTGGICVHTAESAADTVPPDQGAEAVAAFISRRTDAAGSYHSTIDSDSIVRVMPYEWEAFHEGTGSNPWSLGLSFACHAAAWPTLPSEWIYRALRNGATEAGNMARWVQATTGIVVPARRITPAEYRAGKPGFVGHGDLDPGRRTDPGPAFPWDEFLAYFGAGMQAPAQSDKEIDVKLSYLEAMQYVRALYSAYRGAPPSQAEESDWGREMARVCIIEAKDPWELVRFIALWLRDERAQREAAAG